MLARVPNVGFNHLSLFPQFSPSLLPFCKCQNEWIRYLCKLRKFYEEIIAPQNSLPGSIHKMPILSQNIKAWFVHYGIKIGEFRPQFYLSRAMFDLNINFIEQSLQFLNNRLETKIKSVDNCRTCLHC